MPGLVRHLLLLVVSFLAFLPALSQGQIAPQAPAPVAFVAKRPAVTLNPSGEKPPSIPPETRGDVYLVRQRYQAAIDAYAEVTQPSADLWQKRGLAYQMLFDMNDAAHCYSESLQLDPRNAVVLNNLGAVYGSQKDYKAAERMYREAIRFNPNDARVQLNLGTTLLFEQKYKKGWQAYQKALAIQPNLLQNLSGPQIDDPSSVRQLGATSYFRARGCARAGQTECALKYLRKAIDEGFVTAKKAAAESDFASLRANASFQQLLAGE